MFISVSEWKFLELNPTQQKLQFLGNKLVFVQMSKNTQHFCFEVSQKQVYVDSTHFSYLSLELVIFSNIRGQRSIQKFLEFLRNKITCIKTLLKSLLLDSPGALFEIQVKFWYGSGIEYLLNFCFINYIYS